MSADVRFVLCEVCGSEGRIIRGQYEDERDCGPCPECKGTGYMEIEVEPITEDDLIEGAEHEQSTRRGVVA